MNRFQVNDDVAKIVKTNAIIDGDDVKKRNQMTLYCCTKSTGMCTQISSHALDKLHERKWNQPDSLPKNEDVRRVSETLEYDMREAMEDLEHAPSADSYTRLAQTTLAAIILFNRRRPGETSRLKVDTYLKRDNSVNQDMLEHFSPLEKELCRSLGYVEVRGKRGRRVPMMLTAKIQAAIDLLVTVREAVGISDDCPYIFVAPMGGVNADAIPVPLRGTDCVRKVAERTGAANVTATKNQKHLATMMQLVQLSENEMDIVAKFMGHDIRVHKDFYRLPDKTVDVAKVTKLLMVTDKGMGAFVGSTLDELDPTKGRNDESAGTKEITNANDEGEDLGEARLQKNGRRGGT